MNKPVMDDIHPALCGQSIALVGMMGVGKTTVGRRLAKRLGLDFYDSDEEIESASGRTVKGYFKDHGEEAFRRGERKVIRRLLSGPPIVLATGGGAFIPKATRRALQDGALTLWLKADFETIFVRVQRKNTRPLLDVPDPAAALKTLIADRYPLYEKANVTVDANVGPHSRTVDNAIKAIMSHLKLEAN
ncbi:MAG: shikimate kinase [Robiginitomaculum sp.]